MGTTVELEENDENPDVSSQYQPQIEVEVGNLKMDEPTAQPNSVDSVEEEGEKAAKTTHEPSSMDGVEEEGEKVVETSHEPVAMS
ncbi:hypothetical protein K7X08_011315 [Anisodus acutangulus]|uniref:Uncharacterized protein n=1 Tax=Anisodus acutangulus TaxID=402998 RepID=A0A9Q1RAM1_9SOLA|nr:hypothetical protein K7X08_011315 [Anisodus acutangulus]